MLPRIFFAQQVSRKIPSMARQTTTTDNDSEQSGTRETGVTRKNRGIRFSDSEWQQIDKLAIEHGVSSSELVRQTMIAMANGRFPVWFDVTSPALSAGLQTQIEKIYRATYMLVTLKRDEMYREGRKEELDAVHEDARNTQEAIMESDSDS